MKWPPLCLLTLVFVLSIVSCEKETPIAPVSTDTGVSLEAISPELLAMALVEKAGWPIEEMEDGAVPLAIPLNAGDGIALVEDFERQIIVDDIAHYSFQVRVGSGPYDVIGIHRVVQERRPNWPIRTRKSIFLQHGDIKDFTGMFLPGVTSPTMPDDFGMAVYLSQAGIDVWGIDQGWTLVPTGTTDFTFMADWGLNRNIEDLDTGITVARLVRLITGNGYRKMHLLGYSSGSATGFAFLNAETQLPVGQRNVKGFIGVDYGLKSDDPDFVAALTDEYHVFLELLEAGVYYIDSPFPLFGPPARDFPDDPSGLIEGLTNLQAAIGLGTWPGYPGTHHHFLGGIFDEEGTPIGLQYTDIDMWIDFMVSGPPYEALRFMADYEACVAEEIDVPWDDHLGEIVVPIYYVSAVGGAGEYASHTLDFLGSDDITRLDVGFHPPDEIFLEFAHVDLFIANDAPTLVFEPILNWIEDHSQGGGHGHRELADQR